MMSAVILYYFLSPSTWRIIYEIGKKEVVFICANKIVLVSFFHCVLTVGRNCHAFFLYLATFPLFLQTIFNCIVLLVVMAAVTFHSPCCGLNTTPNLVMYCLLLLSFWAPTGCQSKFSCLLYTPNFSMTEQFNHYCTDF